MVVMLKESGGFDDRYYLLVERIPRHRYKEFDIADNDDDEHFMIEDGNTRYGGVIKSGLNITDLPCMEIVLPDGTC